MSKRIVHVFWALGLLAWVATAWVRPASASYAYYVGKNLTADSSILIGGTGEEASSHWLEIVPRARHPEGATIEVGVTEKANIPGERIRIPQARVTYRYAAMFYSEYLGFPAPLVNGGLNEHQVAVRDVWAPARPELVEMTPTPQRGLSYSDLARLVLERARTARGGVELIGRLIAEHGYATYGGNSHLIADPREAWIVLELPGGQGLWVAERLGPDEVRVLYPGDIGDVPRDYARHPGFMGSENLISFAVEQGWYDPDSGEPFNVYEVYGKQGGEGERPRFKRLSPAQIEGEMRAFAPEIDVRTMMRFVRNPRISDDEAGYGQVVSLKRGTPPELLLMWTAPTGSVTAPFVPWYLGAEAALPEFAQHRYLTKGAASQFMAPEFALQEATRFAGRVFKQLMYLTCAHPLRFYPEVHEALEAFERERLAEQETIEGTARALLRSGERDLARDHLTRYSHAQARAALDLGEALLASIEARTKLLYGIEPRREGSIHTVDKARTLGCWPGGDPDVPSAD